MLLLDKNAEPKKTIFYLSAIVHGLILKRIVNIESLYIELQKEIYELAKQNARNIVEALIKPFVEQLDDKYELKIN